MKYILIAGVFLFTLTGVKAQTNNLDHYVSTAISNNPLLNDYNNQVKFNNIEGNKLLATYKPQVNAVSNNMYAPSIQGWGYDPAITNGGNYSALVTVNKAIIPKKMLDLQQASIRLLSLYADNAAKITAQDIKRTVTAQYITAYGDLSQLQYNNDVLDLLRKEEIILKKMTESSIYRQTDYLSFVVTLRQQELTVTQTSNQYKNDYALLNYICGITDTSSVVLTNPGISLQSIPDFNTTAFARQFQIDSLKLINADKLIDYEYKPRISLFTDGGYLSSFAYQGYKNFGISAGINISLPVYDGRQKKMKHDQVAVQEDSRKGYCNYYEKQYRQQLLQLFQQLQQADDLIFQATAQLKYAQALIDANGKQLHTGDVRIADYILAFNNYLTAQNIITQNTVSKMLIINQINYWNK